ncbi:hypothetical protein HUN01_00135 (plasmid) [Nostoc edaphicum CCNP1411]|uniref:Radical SAM protein n=1 Tax=Nostoc edaphicum CCNP1411 TaxID=1472755 RepID=A0A7D7Q8V1_9NOSO|nr:hypothetical protein [Nostoc edaphicum]QMS86077.1 hypothetical protein HUN01_00135 [Nostoc edaphicum CCNP1411]
MSKIDNITLHPALLDIVDYRKSGLSLNHIVGCPLNCAYCVRHFFDNFDLKKPTILATDEEAVNTLVSHQFFIPHLTPLQLFNRATDPFLPDVRLHTHKVLQLLDERAFTNLMLIITRYKVTAEDMELLESLRHLRVTLLVTYSGLPDGEIEPLSHSITRKSIETIAKQKRRTKLILYWRPIVPGWNDDEETIRHTLSVAEQADAIAYTGLFYRPEQENYFDKEGIKIPYELTHRRKILPAETEARILKLYNEFGGSTPLFRKTSCAVSFAHELPDYNGHYGIPELCNICPQHQVKRCTAAYKIPSTEEVTTLLNMYGYETDFEIDDHHVWTIGLGEQKRYHLQHTLGFQIWDRGLPHLKGQHGRAPIGYPESFSDPTI